MSHPLFLVVLALAFACQRPPVAKVPDIKPDAAQFEYLEWTIERAQAWMSDGRLSSEQLTQAYLDRIAQMSHLNAVIAVTPNALEQARALDAERKQGAPRGPLHGIPLLIKDNIAVAELPNTGGSLALAQVPTLEDAEVIKRLREAGAVIVGKTNLSEWANFRGRRSSSGWSAVGGQTRNPYVLDRNACGSSSGSGSAVSANLAMAALGTETDGSIVCPSSVNGIVGLKPTVGTLSGAGVIPISPTQDTAGPMARTVTDVAVVYAALSQSDERVRAPPLKGLRIGVAKNLAGSITPEVERLFGEAVKKLQDAGVEIVEVEVATQDGPSELKVLIHELGPAMADYLARYTPETAPRTLKDLAEFNSTHAELELRWFGQQWFEAGVEALDNGGLENEEYRAALAEYRPTARSAIDTPLQEHNLAAIIAPTTSPAWPIDLLNGDHSSGGTSGTAAAAGYPLLSLPMGFVEGLPVGATVMNTANSEWQLLSVGLALESVWAARTPPTGLETLELPGPSHTGAMQK